jgi:TolA-binding protein
VLADSLYAEVVKQFPQSSFAPSALYKRAFALEKSQPASARRLYQQLIRDYKTSREATQAQERLRNLPPG